MYVVIECALRIRGGPLGPPGGPGPTLGPGRRTLGPGGGRGVGASNKINIQNNATLRRVGASIKMNK